MEPLFIVVIIAVGITAMILHYFYTLKRREAMAALAAKLGLQYDFHKNSDIARRYKFLDKFRAGRDRYAFNIFSGNYKEENVMIFDYHYKTGSGKDTHHYYLSFYLLFLPAVFPELIIIKEGLFSKIGQALGYDDIDFESHEFSRKFCVRSTDKKFAYDICNARMIEYLLSNTDLSIEIENNVLAIYFNRKLSLDKFEDNLNRLKAIKSLIPEYVFSRR